MEAKADIAIETGNREIALTSTNQAIGRSPDDWTPYFQRRAYGRPTRAAGATAALARARELNPNEPEIDNLAHKLGVRH